MFKVKKTPKQRQWRRFVDFIVNVEHISHFLFHIIEFEQVNVSWERTIYR